MVLCTAGSVMPCCSNEQPQRQQNIISVLVTRQLELR